MARLFLAIPLPDDVRERAAAFVAELKTGGARASFVPAENLHYTLKFLGEIVAPHIADVEREARAIAATVPSFTVQVAGAGAFPGLSSARVVWIGGTADSDGPDRLAAGFEDLGPRFGVAAEQRPFRLHMTVARIRRGLQAPRALGDLLRAHASIELGAFECDNVALYESRLGHGPPRYHRRAALPLA